MRSARRAASRIVATLATAAAASALAATNAAADELPKKTKPIVAPEPVHVAASILAISGYLVTEIGKRDVGPQACSWCDRDALGNDTLNGFDRAVRNALKWRNTTAADTTSSALGFGVAPAGAVTTLVLAAYYDHQVNQSLEDVVAVTEATAFAMDLNQITKFAVARERPFRHAAPVPNEAVDDHLSFFSGHATFTFALAASSGTVASMRGYRLAPMVWASGMAVAATTAYLRIAADKHYATDVLVGALVGTGVGAVVPLAFHRRHTLALGGSATPTGANIAVAGSF